MIEFIKRIIKCKIRNVHKREISSGICIRCGKESV